MVVKNSLKTTQSAKKVEKCCDCNVCPCCGNVMKKKKAEAKFYDIDDSLKE